MVFGLPEAETRKNELWASFKANLSGPWIEGRADQFVWSMLAFAGARAGDRNTLDAWEARLRLRGSRDWPWHVGESAGYLLYLKERQARGI